MEKSQHRHDISDKAWAILEPMLPGQRGQWGGIAEDNRRFINGVFWILRTGAPWRDLPPDYGSRTTENGDLFISGFGDGGIKAYGRRFSKH